MWTCTFLLACLAALSAATPLPEESDRFFQASKEYLHKQKQILKLFLNPYHPELSAEYADIANNYRLEEHIDKYEVSANVKKFVKIEKEGRLFPKDKIYNEYSEQGTSSIIYMFGLFRYARDFDTLIKTAVYLMKHYNVETVYYAFVTALEAREDTRDFYIPPVYEIFPFLFVNEKVIQHAYDAVLKGTLNVPFLRIWSGARMKRRRKREIAEKTRRPTASSGTLPTCEIPVTRTGIQPGLASGNHEKVFVYSNLTDYRDESYDPETKVYLFTEDVGLNALNVEFYRRYPTWWNSHKHHEFHDRKGELYLHYVRQLLARYYLERISNNLGDIPHHGKDIPLPGYYPHLRFFNGQSVTPRQPYTKVRDGEEITIKKIVYYNNNLWRAIDTGYIIDVNGTKIPLDYPHSLNLLGEMVYFSGDSPNKNLYGPYLNKIFHTLGHMADPENYYELPPSALMRPETALRDPLYYSIINKFFKEFIYSYIQTVPKYTKDDIEEHGLHIEGVEVSSLVTFNDYFDIDLRNMFYRAYKNDSKIEVYAKSERLNHRPFNFKVSIDSEKDMDAIMKVYITPKYDSYGRLIPLQKTMFHAFEIDRTYVKVPSGKSTIERECDDSTVAVRDPITASEMWHKVEAALEDKEPLTVDKFARPYGFPQRLLLPKGTEHGMPVQFVVAIFPYQEADTTDRRAYHLGSFPLLGTSYGVKFPDPRPISFPVDRLYRSEYDAKMPNVFIKEVRIFHKTLGDINSVPDSHHH
ncbi:hypothetical protein PR048_006614 [Dryococelus australis]|uniref:Uncharacterized protein n=1 Tax=Dryococelus australis TaxID=614101 RepID=A0ABQ9ICE9_9NEOP|nr:hypothetical protein PR048_006614 [Dryococelus australis]